MRKGRGGEGGMANGALLTLGELKSPLEELEFPLGKLEPTD